MSNAIQWNHSPPYKTSRRDPGAAVSQLWQDLVRELTTGPDRPCHGVYPPLQQTDSESWAFIKGCPSAGYRYEGGFDEGLGVKDDGCGKG